MTYEITYFHIISLIYNAYFVKLSIGLQDLGISNNSYFPITEAEQIIWLTHYSTKLLVNGKLSGIDAAEIIRTQADIRCYISKLQQRNTIFTAKKSKIAQNLHK